MSRVHDAKWAEELTTLADANNPISFPHGGIIHQSTRKALPWTPGRGLLGVPDPNRVEIPSIYIERLFKHAKVRHPKKLAAAEDSFLVKCLDIANYMDGALKYLLDELLKDGGCIDKGCYSHPLAIEDMCWARRRHRAATTAISHSSPSAIASGTST